MWSDAVAQHLFQHGWPAGEVDTAAPAGGRLSAPLKDCLWVFPRLCRMFRGGRVQP